MANRFKCQMCKVDLTLDHYDVYRDGIKYITDRFHCYNRRCKYDTIVVYEDSLIRYYSFYIENNNVLYCLNSSVQPLTTLDIVTINNGWKYLLIFLTKTFFDIKNSNDILNLLKKFLKLSNY